MNKSVWPLPDAPFNPHGVPVERPGSPAADKAIDELLEEYGYPSNMKNAARAGYMACVRLNKLTLIETQPGNAAIAATKEQQ